MNDTQQELNKEGETLAVEINVKQGWAVFLLGVCGPALALVPSVLLLPEAPLLSTKCKFLLPITWACFMGWPITFYWSKAIHNRIKELRSRLENEKLLTEDEQKQSPGRLPWMPAWLGIFERAFYSLLVGLDVTGGSAFIGAWVGIKTVGGWQVWSKGSTYGRAILFSGLLRAS